MTAARQLSDPAVEAAIVSAAKLLRLPTLRERFGEIADAAAREQLTHRAFLAELLLAKCDDRDSRRAARRIHDAGFPRLKTLAEFDFAANPAINPATIAALAGGAWVTKGESLRLIGDSGTGKSHLLIALGTEAARAGRRVRYTLAANWSTNSSRPLTNVSSPAPSPATAASTFSASMNSATWNWTAAEPNFFSRS